MPDKGILLVVEDDIHLLHGIRDILEIEGYQVLTAATGVDGLEVLEEMLRPPDLIISDIMMPRMNGYEFFDAVRARQEWLEVPFVFLTAKGEKQDIHQGKRMGADDYVVKPMDPEELIIIVNAKLKRHAQMRALREVEVEEVKKGIMTILNHEFRTPLTYMVAYSDMLNSDPENLTSDELRLFLKGVNSGADRFRRLVENFIALVELETGEAQQNFTWRSREFDDVNQLCYDAVDMIKFAIEEHGVKVELHLPERIPPCRIDTDYMRSALVQLLENAVKFSNQPGDRVELRVTHDDDHVYFVVQDWGRGIPQAEQAKIWEPFYQINRSQFEDQGAGSGLAIVKGIVTLHGGTIDVQTAPGEGSTFTITLDTVRKQAAAAAEAKQASEQPAS